MKIVRFLFLFSVCFFCYAISLSAQVLDDEPVKKGATLDETDKDEALFNELFSDYSEEDRDITKIKTFDDAMDRVASYIDITDIKSNPEVKEKALPPLEGDILVGITRNSFVIGQNSLNQPVCFFTVTLKSNLTRYIKVLGLNLLYKNHSFAFIFRNINPNKSATHAIRTTGDICYNLTGAPDIDINKCKITGSNGKECAERIRWDENLTDSDDK